MYDSIHQHQQHTQTQLLCYIDNDLFKYHTKKITENKYIKQSLFRYASVLSHL